MAELSVILCTFKRYDLARNCLRHLANQTLDRTRFEVVVIDNTPPAQREAIDWKSLGADRFALEDEAGLSRARNAGIVNSSAPLLAFIDDDAEASPEWAAHVVEAFKLHAEIRVLGGRVVAKYVGRPRPRWMSSSLEGYLSCIDWGSRLSPLEHGQWIVGANMIYRRSVFEEFGTFNASLGRIGHGTLLSNEESQLLGRLATGDVWYSGDAVVEHLIPPERATQPWFRKRVFWQAVSDLLAGFGASQTADYQFERFASTLPLVPAEDRSFRALNRQCSTAEEFEQQMQMLYALSMAQGLGLPDLGAPEKMY